MFVVMLYVSVVKMFDCCAFQLLHILVVYFSCMFQLLNVSVDVYFS